MRWLCVTFLFLVGCTNIPRISFGPKGQTDVIAPKDAGTPATATKEDTAATLGIPAGTVVKVEETPEVPATTSTAYRPPTRMTTYTFFQPTEFEYRASALRASSGTIDTAVATKRIEVQSKQPLLWAAIGCGAGAIALMVLKWPTAAMLAGIGSGCFFAAWRLADIPWWAGLVALLAGGALVLGYKRGEWDNKPT